MRQHTLCKIAADSAFCTIFAHYCHEGLPFQSRAPTLCTHYPSLRANKFWKIIVIIDQKILKRYFLARCKNNIIVKLNSDAICLIYDAFTTNITDRHKPSEINSTLVIETMIRSIKSIVLALGVGCISLSAASAAPLNTDNLQGVAAQNTLQKVQYDRRYDDDRRDSRGDRRDDRRDDRDDRRYDDRGPHRHWGWHPPRWRYCEQLRQACEFERGMGNCRRYRHECGR